MTETPVVQECPVCGASVPAVEVRAGELDLTDDEIADLLAMSTYYGHDEAKAKRLQSAWAKLRARLDRKDDEA